MLPSRQIGQMKSSTQKVLREKMSPEQIASTIVEASMVKMLREAVSIELASQIGLRNPKIENMRLADLWFMISTEKHALKQRYIHYEFLVSSGRSSIESHITWPSA
jgi:hypothetical protein